MEQNVFGCLGHRITLLTPGGDDLISRAIRLGQGFYEQDVLVKCREIHLPGTAIVDVGAHIGNHTVFFARVLGAVVYAFEPYAVNYGFLLENIAGNAMGSRVTAFEAALGASTGRGRAHLPAEDNLGMVRIAPEPSGDIAVRTLDSYDIKLPVGLLKLDVEGGECEVLRGAAALLERDLPDIMLEAAEPAQFAAAARLLLEHGYTSHGRFAATPTYLFSAADQAARMRRLLPRLT